MKVPISTCLISKRTNTNNSSIKIDFSKLTDSQKKAIKDLTYINLVGKNGKSIIAKKRTKRTKISKNNSEFLKNYRKSCLKFSYIII